MADAADTATASASDTPVTLTPAEADRVLKIQDTIIASFRAATEAHKAATARIAVLESDKAALQAEVTELKSHEPNLVDPAVLQPMFDDLAGAVAATHAAIAPHVDPQPAAGQGGDTASSQG